MRTPSLDNKQKPALKQIDKNRYIIEKHGAMRVDGMIFLDDELLNILGTDESIRQVENVACLPGIVGASMAMPDIHWGYGFPIGGVAAFDINDGVISPGGVGYDINCGVRLVRSLIDVETIRPKVDEIINKLYVNIPSGVGSHRKDLKFSRSELKKVVSRGARWAVEEGFGRAEDLQYIEDNGTLPQADAEAVSERAYERGKDQIGTLGSGNHFVEIGYVSEIYDEPVAQTFGLFKDRVTIMIHTGSRGFGYQVCDDSIREMMKASEKYGIYLPDKQLCAAPFESPEGRRYFAAMGAAANYAFANRQMITHWVRETMEEVMNANDNALGLSLLYDVCHNIAKLEKHHRGNEELALCVHRKGATRAFAPQNPALPDKYKNTGQPVLIPGDMGRASYVLCGTEQAMEETFGSTCHGAGRVMSRGQAIKASRGRFLQKELETKGICVKAASKGTLAEEMPEAYKDVSKVVRVVHGAGISRLVAKITPLGCIKG